VFVTSEGYDYHYSCEWNAEGLDGIWSGMLERETEQLEGYVEVSIHGTSVTSV
jgi:hypothetical protein